MKCPKCGYLGFERVDRCRNCGYDFSLTQSPTLPDLSIRSSEADHVGPVDFSLTDAASLAPAGANERSLESSELLRSRPLAALATAELPLFGDAPVGDRSVIAKASPPRPPLAVRRATPELSRIRSGSLRAPMLDLAPAGSESDRPAVPRHARTESVREEPVAAPREPAGVIARAAAGVIDLVVLGGIDFLVLYFTLQVCGLTLGELDMLPKGPLIAFLVVQNGGYLVTFNAGGQTLGKLVMGIRVVGASTGAPFDLGRSLLRTAVWVLLAAPAGLGFLSALFSRDRRGLHDHCAGTRVVRTTAA